MHRLLPVIAVSLVLVAAATAHRDHAQIGMTLAGANARTSFWR